MSVPELRFKKDDGEEFPEWEQKCLADVGENIIGLTYSPSNVTNDESFPIVLRSSNIKEDILDLNDKVRVKEKIPQKLFTQENDILICTRNGSKRLIGKNVLISKAEMPMTFGAFMSVFRSPFNKFIVHLFKTEKYNEQIQMNLGARINQITTKNLNAFKFNFPSPPEQSKVANFLTAVDEKITQLTQKHDLLTQYKKGVMQQIFSQELRFKDDHGEDFPEWEEKSLGEVADVTKLAGYEFTKHIVYRDTGKIIALRGLNVKENKLDLTDVKYIDQSDFSKLSRSKLIIDDLLFTYVGTIGDVALISENDRFYLAPNVSRIRVNKNALTPFFALQYFNNSEFKEKQINLYIATSSQPALSNGKY